MMSLNHQVLKKDKHGAETRNYGGEIVEVI